MPAGDDRDHLVALLRRFPDCHVWVAGDLMLDEYVVGSVERISPEAPVQVVNVTESFSRLGGSANVARSISALGARVSLCGVVGTDPAGDEVLRYCEETGIDAGAVGRLESRPTTRKTRVLGIGQQLLRMDWERSEPCPAALLEPLVARLDQGPPPTALILADYGKGVLTSESIPALTAAAVARSLPVLVDPVGRDYTRYRGASILKPNLRELEEAAGRRLRGVSQPELEATVRSVLEAAGLEGMVVTLGERGMLVVPRGEAGVLIPAVPREVFDVTGAGDTAIAVLALGLSAGAGLVDAARVANTAAGLVIREVGAAAVELEQLISELEPRRTSKAFSWIALGQQVAEWKLQGRQVVFTNGCFDLLHAGHLSLLRRAAELGEVLVVGINSDASVTRLKGPARPLVPERERIAMLAALECVDAVVVFEEDTPLEIIRHVKPDVLVKGQDYRLEEVVGREEVEGSGGRVELVPLLPELSTTSLIDRIRGE